MCLWLLPRSQEEPDFMRGLIRFARTGLVTHDFKAQLRQRAWPATHPSRPYAARLLQHTVARGNDLGPISEDFAAVCDQTDRADAMLAGLRDRVANGQALPETPTQDPSGRPLIAMARHDPASQTATIILDAATANAAVHAISVQAADREGTHPRVARRSGCR